MVLEIITGALAGTGAFLLVSDVFKVPKMKIARAFSGTAKRHKGKVSSVELWLESLCGFVAGKLRLNEYKRMQLESDLQTANMRITPEMHVARALVKAAMVGLLTMPLLFLFPLMAPLAPALVFAVYFKGSKGIQERIKKKRAVIEFELSGLVFFVGKTLAHSRDVLSMLEKYKEDAGPELKYELSVTVADMRSGNYEAALTRLESRVGSAMLSDVVRGLLSVVRGDDTKEYWSTLSVKFSDLQRQLLKQRAQKVPPKVKRLSMTLLFCFMLLYLVVIIVEIMDSLGAMFG